MKKINVAEILKDCPKGMELDCTMFDNVYFERVNENVDYPIRIKVGKADVVNLTKYGCWNKYSNAKCVIFPKGKTTWEGFQGPFKDGDILTSELGSIFILKEPNENVFYYSCYVALTFVSHIITSRIQFCAKKDCRLATEEEKDKLFKTIKEHGYHWNVKNKSLDKLPKFKVGDRIVKKNSGCIPMLIVKIRDNYYYINTESSADVLSISEQDDYELIRNKFDINTLIPFESKVLVRDSDYGEWKGSFWGHLKQGSDIKFDTIRGIYRQCIPYNDDTKHLLGKTNSCDEFYKNW